MNLLQSTLANIQPVDFHLEPEIRAHLDHLTKPPGSLGVLEELALKYCLASGTPKPQLGKKMIFTFAGDHGVTEEGISAFPKEVTPQMVANMLAGGAAVNVLARHAGAQVRVVDLGVASEFPDSRGLISKKIRPGTANISKGPAMSVAEARKAVEAGIELAEKVADEGFTLLGTGEMGIGNTTPSSALFAVLLPCPVEDITGRGTGIDDQKLAHKIQVIQQALSVNQARFTDPLNTLAAVGGLEIAGICGLILGGAARKIPVVVDGFISSAGALVACKLSPPVKDYLFFSHLSAEAGHGVFLKQFGARPILNLDMRLGEGTGAALAITLVEAAVKIYREMATFTSAGVSNQEI
jgi:nicotinate-nucleotide--dimethylbenzimidazole phosphoribosyltransferase